MRPQIRIRSLPNTYTAHRSSPLPTTLPPDFSSSVAFRVIDASQRAVTSEDDGPAQRGHTLAVGPMPATLRDYRFLDCRYARAAIEECRRTRSPAGTFPTIHITASDGSGERCCKAGTILPPPSAPLSNTPLSSRATVSRSTGEVSLPLSRAPCTREKCNTAATALYPRRQTTCCVYRLRCQLPILGPPRHGSKRPKPVSIADIRQTYELLPERRGATR